MGALLALLACFAIITKLSLDMRQLQRKLSETLADLATEKIAHVSTSLELCDEKLETLRRRALALLDEVKE